MVRGVTITMLSGEPTLVFWRIEDVGEGLEVSRDMGLPLTSPRKVAHEFLECIRMFLLEDPGPEPEVGE